MVQLLYGNAASLPTTLGGGHHGHIGLIMAPLLYAIIITHPNVQVKNTCLKGIPT